MTDFRALADSLVDAYSYERYGQAEFRRCAKLLMERGYNERQTEAILRSKWMRWAADVADTRSPRASHLARFMDDPRNRVTADAVAALVEQTFFVEPRTES